MFDETHTKKKAIVILSLQDLQSRDSFMQLLIFLSIQLIKLKSSICFTKSLVIRLLVWKKDFL